jgi:phage FluMu gp28-like protein
MTLTTTHRAALRQYELALPAPEYAALAAWLSTFYPFQLEWVLEPSDYAICCKSRQIGMSHSTAACAVLWGAFHGELTTVISVGERESVEVLEKAKLHREVLCRLGSKMAVKRRRDNDTEIDFASGGRIMALPASGGRSFSGNIFLDEYAYQERAAKVWDAALAVTMHGYRARIASTPNGVGNDFYEVWSDPTKGNGWSKHEIPLKRALDEGMRVDVDRCWKMAKGDPRLFAQLFECKFLDGEFQYIPTAAIEACQFDLLPPAISFPFGYYAGLDVGRDNDLTVIEVLGLDANRVPWNVYTKHCKRTDADALRQLVRDAFERFNLRKLCVDSTGIGTFPVDDMKKAHGVSRVEAVTFTQLSKEELATGLYTAITQQRLALPRRDGALKLDDYALGEPDALKHDLCAIRREVTSAGNVRYDAPRTDKGHADRAWALALALRAVGSRPPDATVGQDSLGIL